MKKALILLISLILLLTSCSVGKPKYISEVAPSQLLTVEDITPYLDYTPELSEELSRRGSVARYLSNPKGQGDPVIVKVYQKNGLLSQEKVEAYFDECKKMRSDAFDVAIEADKAFIAYPTLHYYINGYHIEITAGSGNDDLQKVLLTNLAKISIANFNELTGIYKGSQENTEEYTQN